MVADRTQALGKNGYVVIPNAVAQNSIKRLKADIHRYLRNHPAQRPHGIRNLCSRVPEVAELAESVEIQALLSTALGREAFLVRSIFFDKVPEANWKVAWHQDITIAVASRIPATGFGPWTVKEGVVSVQPPAEVLESMLTVRIHLDDCAATNGPVRVIRGSHVDGKLGAAAIKDWVHRGCHETCIVPEGGVLLMKPLLLHASSPSADPDHRRVVHLDFSNEPLPFGLQWDRWA